MTERRSVFIDEFKHRNPIPNASRIGNLVMSGVIMGRHPETGAVPETIEEQCAYMFRHMKSTVEAAGGTTNNIIKVTVWMKDPSDRSVLNAEWVKMFPDENARPARQTLPDASDSPFFLQCDFTAVIG